MGGLETILAIQESKKMPTSQKVIIGSILGIVGCVAVFILLKKSFGIEPFSDLYHQLFQEEEQTSSAIRATGDEINDVHDWIGSQDDLDEPDRQRGIIETHQISIRNQYALIENYEDLMQICMTSYFDNKQELTHVLGDIKHIQDWWWILWVAEQANLNGLIRLRDQLKAQNADFVTSFEHYQALWRAEVENYSKLINELILLENEHLVFIADYILTHTNYEIDWVNDVNHKCWNEGFSVCYSARKSAGLPSTSAYGVDYRPL